MFTSDNSSDVYKYNYVTWSVPIIKASLVEHIYKQVFPAKLDWAWSNYNLALLYRKPNCKSSIGF